MATHVHIAVSEGTWTNTAARPPAVMHRLRYDRNSDKLTRAGCVGAPSAVLHRRLVKIELAGHGQKDTTSGRRLPNAIRP